MCSEVGGKRRRSIIASEMVEISALIGLFYVIFTLPIPAFFIVRYIITAEFEVKVKPWHKSSINRVTNIPF